MKIYVEEAVFSLLPDLTLFCLEADLGKLRENGREGLEKDFRTALERALERRKEKDEALPPVDPLQAWKKVFGKFTSEKGVKTSFEALLASSRAGRPESRCPVEEAQKAVSLYFSVPLFGLDLPKVQKFLGLCLSQGRDPFLEPEGKESLTREGEICYMDRQGALSRCINWKNSPRTAPTGQSRKVLFISESPDKDSRMRTGEAVRDLERRLNFYFGADTKSFVLDSIQTAKRI
ncbi:MAG: hypothetical protein IKT06_00505 [Aeriscardovia sp.]|nr:hypothetical protein [Aeriscardovia sp.]